jgi:phenylpropionate dioxygenase-like ring-hydroxylating dioxygenase large terminal subunit
MKVIRYDEGNTPVFSCPYHGWSYSTDGRLVKRPGELLGVPHYRDAYHEALDKSQWGLIHVPQMVNYKGTIWACWDPEAPSFSDYLGDYVQFLDHLLDPQDGSEWKPGATEVIGGVIRWRVPCNWKFPAENFVPDPYHTISHRSVEIVGIGPGGPGETRMGTRRAKPQENVSFPRLGHGTGGAVPHLQDYDPFPKFISPVGPVDNPPVVEEYYRQIAQERMKRLGNSKKATSGVGTVFPNFSYHAAGFPRAFFVWHPHGPTATEIWRWGPIVDTNAPKEVKDLIRHHFLRYSGPAGLTEQDDMENWNYATAASKGTIARRYPYNYSMGMGHEQPVEGMEGAEVIIGLTEHTARGMYRRWAELMEAESWNDLYPKRR